MVRDIEGEPKKTTSIFRVDKPDDVEEEDFRTGLITVKQNSSDRTPATRMRSDGTKYTPKRTAKYYWAEEYFESDPKLAKEFRKNPHRYDDELHEVWNRNRATDLYYEDKIERYEYSGFISQSVSVQNKRHSTKNKKESYLESGDKSSMKMNGKGKGWHGERMRHREASMRRRK